MSTRAAYEDEIGRISAPTEPGAIAAAERAVEAAQRIVVERLELLRLETQDALASAMTRAGLLLAAGFIAILGWCGLAAALVFVMAEHIPLAPSLAIVGGAHVLMGIILGVAAASSARRKT
jgi:hypothetical protein